MNSQMGTSTLMVLPKRSGLTHPSLLYSSLTVSYPGDHVHSLLIFFHFSQHLLICRFSLSSFFQLSHLTWSHFVFVCDYFLFPPFPCCGLPWRWWTLQHHFSEEVRIQREKTRASLQFGSWQQPRHGLSAWVVSSSDLGPHLEVIHFR